MSTFSILVHGIETARVEEQRALRFDVHTEELPAWENGLSLLWHGLTDELAIRPRSGKRAVLISRGPSDSVSVAGVDAMRLKISRPSLETWLHLAQLGWRAAGAGSPYDLALDRDDWSVTLRIAPSPAHHAS